MENIFTNQIDAKKFRSTNGIWNDLCLNSPWGIGYVSSLIESETFSTKDDWKDFYFKSGEERLIKISELEKEKQDILLDYTLPLQKKYKAMNSLDKSIKELNFTFGRTEKELFEKGKTMYLAICKQGNKNDITLAECVYMVKYRILAETWNGIISREQNTISKLSNKYSHLDFVKTEGDFDYKYGVDYEVFENGSLIGAIQIKPKSYQNGSTPSIQKAKKANMFKNMAYTKKYGAITSYVYSTTKGDIINPESLAFLNSHISNAV